MGVDRENGAEQESALTAFRKEVSEAIGRTAKIGAESDDARKLSGHEHELGVAEMEAWHRCKEMVASLSSERIGQIKLVQLIEEVRTMVSGIKIVGIDSAIGNFRSLILNKWSVFSGALGETQDMQEAIKAMKSLRYIFLGEEKKITP